jgi:Protein of unknown function (DUF4232)
MMRSARWIRGAFAGFAAMAAIVAVTAAAWATTSSGKGHASAAASGILPRCTAPELGVWVAADHGQGAAGSTFIPLDFTNVGHRTCRLQGLPAVAALDRNGHQLGPAAGHNHLFRPRTVTLAPGRTAHAVLQYIQAVATNCPVAQQVPAFVLKVNPPHGTRADHALFDFETCPGNTVYLDVTAIRAGILQI